MSKQPAPPTLTDPVGMGGMNASDGFDYQVWDGLIRLPPWLRHSAFEEMAFEVLEDLEARFFSPHSPKQHLLLRFQAKSGEQSTSKLKDVFGSFMHFKASFGEISHVQTLVTPKLPSTLEWLAKDGERIKKAKPFYAPFSNVQAASDAKFRNDLTGVFGNELGGFIADSVDVSLRVLPDRQHAQSAFSTALHSAFPDLDVSSKKVDSAFKELYDLAMRKRGHPLARRELLETIEQSLGTSLLIDPSILALHIRSNRNDPEADAVEIDASRFSDPTNSVLTATDWDTLLSDPLRSTAAWATKNGYRRIRLSGQYRLSVAFTVGYAFRAATGFEVDVPDRSGGVWPTDVHPTPSSSPLSWEISEPAIAPNETLQVAIGIIRDPTNAVMSSFQLNDRSQVLSAVLNQAITNAVDVQSSIRLLKGAITAAATRLRVKQINLAYVGPSSFAVALAHRWNALPPTQLFEFSSPTQRYLPSAYIR